MKKADIIQRYYGGKLPCINIKCYNFPTADNVEAKFGCSTHQAQKAVEFAYNAAVSNFRRNVYEVAKEIFNVEFFSEGRSGGWLTTDQLPEVYTWDAVMVAKWGKLARVAKQEIEFQSEFALENIENNQWHKEGAEEYNFIDRKDGSTACIADLKAAATAAGYGEVIR